MENGEKKKCLYIIFRLTRRSRLHGKNTCFFAILSHEQQVTAFARHILTTDLQKRLYNWHCKLLEFIVTASHCEESTRRKQKQPRDFSDARKKSKELTTPPEPPNTKTMASFVGKATEAVLLFSSSTNSQPSSLTDGSLQRKRLPHPGWGGGIFIVL